MIDSIGLNEEMGKKKLLHIFRGEAILNTTQKGKGKKKVLPSPIP